jgi:hypothetical protein
MCSSRGKKSMNVKVKGGIKSSNLYRRIKQEFWFLIIQWCYPIDENLKA